jgi:hypothetical protein
MRHPIPPIRADEATLRERLQREHDGHRKPRLQRLCLRGTRQAQDRQDGVRLLGVHRHPIGRWLAAPHQGTQRLRLGVGRSTSAKCASAPASNASVWATGPGARCHWHRWEPPSAPRRGVGQYPTGLSPQPSPPTHGTARRRPAVCPTWRIRAPWHQTTGRTLGV